MLAEQFGWIGFAADIYGAELQGDLDADTRREQATKYRSNNTLFYGRIQAAVDVMAAHRLVMADKIAVIGCTLSCLSVNCSDVFFNFESAEY